MTETVESAVVGQLLLSYFSAINLHYVTVFNCGDPEENHDLVKSFSNHGVFADLIRLSDDTFDATRHGDKITNGYRTKVGIVLNYECPGSDDFVSKCVQLKCFSTSKFWLIIDRQENQTIFGFLSTLDLFVDAEIKVLTHDGLYDVYNNGRSHGGRINVTLDRNINQELSTLGPSRLDEKSKYENRRTLSDLTLRVGTVSQRFPRLNDSIEQIVKHLESDTDRHMDHALRFGHRLTQALHSTLSYNIHYIHYDCWTFNDSTGGILGALVNQEIDYSATGLMTKIKRMEHLASVLNYMTFELMFIFKTPEATQLTDNAFIRPFQTNVWLMILLTLILGSITMKLSFTVEYKLQDAFKAKENPSFSGLIVEFLGNYCQQGSQYMPESLSGRSMQLFILLCTLMVYNYYTSEIVSDLIGSHKESNIKTLVQLADSHLDLGIENVTYEKAFFYESHLPDVDYLTRKKVTEKTFVNSSVGLQRVRRGNFAYNCERNVAYNLIWNTFDSTEVCDLNELESMPTQFVDHVVRKDSPFRELFKVKYTRILEVGIKKKFSDYWVAKKPKCSSGSIISSVTITGALPIFVLLGFGLMLSAVVFGTEVVTQFAVKNSWVDRSLDQIVADKIVKKKFL
ncbi:ionotropic receptor 75a-like [Ochlerotatus camptorhynchus]|uniref:ionotropic receptor 75a-like n=1 Tax=Ochlerotatus camptorhynchus TaxID=644619 RepID=UPI0031D6C5C2